MCSEDFGRCSRLLRFGRRYAMMVLIVGLLHVGATPSLAAGPSKSDINGDGVVDLEDVKLFAQTVLEVDWQTFDWCAWILIDGRDQNRYDELVDFIRKYYKCDDHPEPPPPPPPPDPLAPAHENVRPTRMAWGPDGRLYVSDAKIKSVFIYELVTNELGAPALALRQELQRVGSVVGLAVDDAGVIFVGNTEHRRVDKYNLSSELVGTVGAGTIRLPTDLTFDAEYNLYVADSEADVVWVFARDGSLLRSIRRGGLKMPMGVEVTYVDDGTGNMVGELFVASKGDYLIKVFDLNGNPKRSFGGFVQKVGWFNPTWVIDGKFVSLQSLAIDQHGNLHAVDSYMNLGQVLNPLTGAFISSYSESGTAAGQMKLPLDVVVSPSGSVIVANTENHRVEIIHQVP